MRESVMIIAEITDDSPEDSNWLVDTIALENVIHERLAEAVTVHEVKAIKESQIYWYDHWNNGDGHLDTVGCLIPTEKMFELRAEFMDEHPPTTDVKDEDAVSEYNQRFLNWLRGKGHKIFSINRPTTTFGWSELE